MSFNLLKITFLIGTLILLTFFQKISNQNDGNSEIYTKSVKPPRNYLNITKAQVISEIEDYISSASVANKSRYFFFMKTHKTASSTIQNIMLRYADFYKLDLAIPTFKHDPARFNYPLYSNLINQKIKPDDIFDGKPSRNNNTTIK